MKIYWPIGLSMDMPGRTTSGPDLEPLLEEYAHSLVSAGTTVKVGWMSKTTSLLSSNAMMCGLQVNLYPLSLTQSNIFGYDLNKASLESPAGMNQTLS